MSKKIVVIYHRADFDGLFCREIARKFLGESAEYIGWDYGDPKIPWPSEVETIYVLDLSPESFESMPDINEVGRHLIWIDHHKSAIDKWPSVLPGYRIDGVAACRLAWQWFAHPTNPTPRRDPDGVALLPLKEEYIARKLSEPYAVQLAGEYDIWDKRNPMAETFQFGLRSVEELDWKALLAVEHGVYTDWLEERGSLLQKYQQRQDAEIVNHLAFIVEFEGLKFLALNSTSKSSLQFKAKDVPETGHDALLKFNWTGKVWDVSLYHAKHNTGIDLSTIAVKYGGGGHWGACGFRADTLPFIP